MKKWRLHDVKQRFSHLLGKARAANRRPKSDVGDFKRFLMTGPRFDLPEIERPNEPERTIDL